MEAMEGGKAEMSMGAPSAPVLTESRSLVLDMPADETELSAKFKKAKRQGVAEQLTFSAITTNAWSSLLNQQPLVCLDNADHRWFSKHAIDALRQLGIKYSLVKQRPNWSCVSFPSSHGVRQCFKTIKAKLAQEKADCLAFPGLTQQADELFGEMPESKVVSLTDQHLPCPMIQQIDAAKDKFKAYVEDTFSTDSVPPEGSELREPIVVWMDSVDRLKLVQFMLQCHAEQLTSCRKVPSLVLQLLAHLRPEDCRRLCPNLRDFEIDFKHAIGGICAGLPGFQTSAVLGMESRPSVSDATHNSRGNGSSSTAMATATTGGFEPPMSPVMEPDFLRLRCPPIPSGESLVATLYAYWSEYLCVNSVHIEHLDGFLTTIVQTCLDAIDPMTTEDAFQHWASSLGVPAEIHCMSTPAWVTNAEHQRILQNTRRRNHTVMQSLSSEIYKILYMLRGQHPPEARFVSAVQRACCLDATKAKASAAKFLDAEKFTWAHHSFKKIKMTKCADLLLSHGHLSKFDELRKLQTVAANDNDNKADPLQAMVVEGAHASDLSKGLLDVLDSNRFFLASFVDAPKHHHRLYDGVYKTLFAARLSDISLYQRYAAIRYHDPWNGTIEQKRGEGIHTQRLSFAPTLLQMMLSPFDAHRLTAVVLLREWMGYPTLTAAMWNDHTRAVAKRALRIIDCAAVNKEYASDDTSVLLKITQMALAFDTRASTVDEKELDDHPQVPMTWCPGVVSATHREPISYASVVDMLSCFVVVQEGGHVAFMEQMIAQLQTIQIEGPPRQDMPPGYVDTAYSRAGLSYQASTAHRIEKPIAPSACTVSHDRCTRIGQCLQLQEMEHFGYPKGADQVKGLLLNVEHAAEDARQFTGIYHVCAASYEFGVAMHTSASGVSVASPTSRLYIPKPSPTHQVDVWPRYFCFERQFAPQVKSRFYLGFNTEASKLNASPKPQERPNRKRAMTAADMEIERITTEITKKSRVDAIDV